MASTSFTADSRPVLCRARHFSSPREAGFAGSPVGQGRSTGVSSGAGVAGAVNDSPHRSRKETAFAYACLNPAQLDYSLAKRDSTHLQSGLFMNSL